MVAAIGTVICLKEVASEPLFRLPELVLFEFVAIFGCFSSSAVSIRFGELACSSSVASWYAASSSLKLTRLGDFAVILDDDDGVGEVALWDKIIASMLGLLLVLLLLLLFCGPASGLTGVPLSPTIAVVEAPSKLLRLAEGEMFGVGCMTLISMDWQVNPRFKSRLIGDGRVEVSLGLVLASKLPFVSFPFPVGPASLADWPVFIDMAL